MAEKDSEILEEVLEQTKRKETLEEEIEQRTKDLKLAWLSNVPIEDHSILEKKYAEDFRMSLSDARKELKYTLTKYEIEGSDIPRTIKQLKKYSKILNFQFRCTVKTKRLLRKI